MATFASDFFRVISDGEKIVFLRDDGVKRECYLYDNPLLTKFSVNIERPMHEVLSHGGYREYVPGLIDCSAELSFRGGMIQMIDRPLIMGVDLFDRLSITDYLDIINEKIKRR